MIGMLLSAAGGLADVASQCEPVRLSRSSSVMASPGLLFYDVQMLRDGGESAHATMSKRGSPTLPKD